MKTKLTLIMSIILVLIIIFLLLFFGRNLFRRDNPEINSFHDFSQKEIVYLNKDNFFFGFLIKDREGNPLNDTEKLKIFKFHISNNKDEIKEENFFEKNNTNISVVRCKEEYMKGFSDTDDKIKENILQYGLCLNFNNNLFDGSPIYGDYKNIIFRIFLDRNVYDQFSPIGSNKYKFPYFPFNVIFFVQNYIYKKDNYNDPFEKK